MVLNSNVMLVCTMLTEFMKAISCHTNTVRTVAITLALLAAQGAMVAGFDDVTSMATTVRTIYTLVVVVAGIIVLWQCFEGAQHRKQWGDILITCLWVIGAAASIAFVTWLWTKGGSMTF